MDECWATPPPAPGARLPIPSIPCNKHIDNKKQIQIFILSHIFCIQASIYFRAARKSLANVDLWRGLHGSKGFGTILFLRSHTKDRRGFGSRSRFHDRAQKSRLWSRSRFHDRAQSRGFGVDRDSMIVHKSRLKYQIGFEEASE